MSRLRCRCGNVIRDITDFLPYKAYFLPDEDTETALDELMTRVAEFIEARERGEQEAYLTGLGSMQRWPTLKETLMHSLVLNPNMVFGRIMYECDECGRLWLEAKLGDNKYAPYRPETASRGVLTHEGAPPPTEWSE